MRMVLRNGFAHPSQSFKTDDELDEMINDAEQRSVVVQGVRCVRYIAGMLSVEFHDGRAALSAQMETGWLNSNETTLRPTMKPGDGRASVVAGKFVYSDYDIEQMEAAA